jgi:hypothetical protein
MLRHQHFTGNSADVGAALRWIWPTHSAGCKRRLFMNIVGGVQQALPQWCVTSARELFENDALFVQETGLRNLTFM